MRRFWTLLAAPLAIGLASVAQGGIFCGGCSDPCGGGSRLGLCGRGGSSYAQGNGCYAGNYGGSSYGNGSYGYAASGSCGVSSGYRGFGPSVASYGIPMSSSYAAQTYGNGSGCYTAPSYASPSYSMQSYAAPLASSMQQVEQLSAPITTYQVSMQPSYVTETQMVATTEYQDEVRYRVKRVYRSVPIEEQRYRMKTLMIPKTETKTIEYEVLVPETTQKSVELTTTVPVWNEVNETYTIKVPTLVDVPETYTVKVPVLKDEPFSYTVQVPTPEKSIRTQTVSNAVPVTKTRTVQRSVPRTSTRTVQKDYGHWETVIDEVSVMATQPQVAPQVNVVAMGGCGTTNSYYSIGQCGTASGSNCTAARAGNCRSCGCGRASSVGASSCRSNCGCGSVNSVCGIATSNGCGIGASTVQVNAVQPSCGTVSTYAAPVTRSRRVWVPNMVTEEVPVIENDTVNEEVSYTVYEQHSEQIQYEHTQINYRPEVRTGTKKVVDYVDEPRSRTRKQVEYRDESRTRVKKELTYKQESKTETFPVVSYKSEKRTKEISFTVQVPEVQAEAYTTTRYDQVAEDIVEEYSVKVPVPSYREIQVQVCKMVPTLVPVTIQPAVASNCIAPAQPTVTVIGSEYRNAVGHGHNHAQVHGNAQSYPFIQSGCQSCGSGFGYGMRAPSCNCGR